MTLMRDWISGVGFVCGGMGGVGTSIGVSLLGRVYTLLVFLESYNPIECSIFARAAKRFLRDLGILCRKKTKALNSTRITRISVSEICTPPTPPWWKSTNLAGSLTLQPFSSPKTRYLSTQSLSPKSPLLDSSTPYKSIGGKGFLK